MKKVEEISSEEMEKNNGGKSITILTKVSIRIWQSSQEQL